MTKTLHTDGHLALIEALILARKSQKLSQAALAERLKCHQSFVARIESGQRRIDVPELVIVARALDVPAEYFFDAVIKAVPSGERI
ncbi:MAG: helix-turn-helix transcriptional regulator [Paracoccaceae bacterium]